MAEAGKRGRDTVGGYASSHRSASELRPPPSGPGIGVVPTDSRGDQVPPPTLSRTFSWCDGGEVGGEYGWVTVEDPFCTEWEPRAYVVETWERTAAEVRWAFPPLSDCGHGDCDEDAVVWQRDGDTWVQACEQHRTEGSDG